MFQANSIFPLSFQKLALEPGQERIPGRERKLRDGLGGP